MGAGPSSEHSAWTRFIAGGTVGIPPLRSAPGTQLLPAPWVTRRDEKLTQQRSYLWTNWNYFAFYRTLCHLKHSNVKPHFLSLRKKMAVIPGNGKARRSGEGRAMLWCRLLPAHSTDKMLCLCF